MTDTPFRILFVIYPGMTQLDFTVPHQFLTRLPNSTTIIASPAGGEVSADGLTFAHTVPVAQVEGCDLLCLPGGGGVTAGIDFALTVLAELAGDELAQSVQLGLEYAPAPPFEAGTPETAPASVLARYEVQRQRGVRKRKQRRGDLPDRTRRQAGCCTMSLKIGAPVRMKPGNSYVIVSAI